MLRREKARGEERGEEGNLFVGGLLFGFDWRCVSGAVVAALKGGLGSSVWLVVILIWSSWEKREKSIKI
jgi:hypothetical protein